MNLNQITIGVTDVPAAIPFYEALGLILIVHTHDDYARFEMPDGGATFSLHRVDEVIAGTTLVYFEVEDVAATSQKAEAAGAIIESGPTKQSWLWEETRLRDPFGNTLCFYHAGDARRFPPWRKDT